MLTARLLCFCASLLLAAPAFAQDAPFVTQLRLAARGTVSDTFAWRTADGIEVDASTLQALGISTPGAGRIQLRAIPGLTYVEDEASSAIEISCTMRCYAAQRLAPEPSETLPLSRDSGGYLNYDLDLQWLNESKLTPAGVVEGVLFGRLGLLETSWLAHDGRTMRLESRWTLDLPQRGLRMRVGDSTRYGVGGAPVRFGGVEIGRNFGLTPSMITYPTPTLAGEAQTASMVEIYVDGALRAREQVAAGPFVLEHAPVVSGGGQAQLVVTDLLGREQIISRPFFVSTTMLRAGLSDWSLAAGAERRAYGMHDTRYGRGFAAGRYRRGITNALTLETAAEVSDGQATGEMGIAFADALLGQMRVTRAEGDAGAATTAAWYRDNRAWSAGVQWESRETPRDVFGGESRLRESVAANASATLGNYGDVSLTAAQARFVDQPQARTLSLAYTPDRSGLSFRLLYSEHEEETLAFGVSYSLSLRGDVSAHTDLEIEERGATYRAGMQRSPHGQRGFGWRARMSAGAHERVEVSGAYSSAFGESVTQAAYVEGMSGFRLGHAGSVGWIERTAFVGPPIRGAFALVDVGVADAGVTRDRLRIGATGRDGRVLATNLRPYDVNTIGVEVDDLPLDRAPASASVRVSPVERGGVIVQFAEARERMIETRVRYANGSAPLRGAVLVRLRDGARFPVGSDGRVVLLGASDGDVLQLEGDARCSARGDDAAADSELTLVCAAA